MIPLWCSPLRTARRTLGTDESVNGLQEDGDSQSKKKGAVEKCTDDFCSLPSKR